MTVIFANGFEEGDFTAWNRVAEVSAGSTMEVKNTKPYQGTYSAHSISAGNANDYASIGEDTLAMSDQFFRAYYNFTQLNIANGDHLYLGFCGAALNTQGPGITNSGGNLMWEIVSNVGGVYTYPAGTHIVSLNTWYCVEFERNVTGDLQYLWIDGILEASDNRNITGDTTTTYFGNANQTGNGVMEFYFDQVVISDQYIGTDVPMKGIVTGYATVG